MEPEDLQNEWKTPAGPSTIYAVLVPYLFVQKDYSAMAVNAGARMPKYRALFWLGRYEICTTVPLFAPPPATAEPLTAPLPPSL
jgi:hypothetical protein